MKTGIAGGIGSGKSFVAQRLALRGITVYDCDAAAKRLMRTSPKLRRQLTALIGPDTYKANYTSESNGAYSLNKAVVSRFLLASQHNQHALNAIVHPAVFADFIESGQQWLESAIMFESGANRYVDRVVVVTAPLETRLERIQRRDGISRAQALEWIRRQWPQEHVRQLADYEIINDGQADVDSQIDQFLAAIRERQDDETTI